MGFGIVGAKDVLDVAYWGGTTAEVQSNFQNMLDALASAASRQEVSNAPLFSFGHSKGAFAASMVAQGMPERTLGFFSDKTVGFANDDLGVAASVPGLSVAGEGDEYIPEEYARLAFDSWRGQGAEVALAVEGGGHNQTNSNLRFAFIDEVLKVRYPHGQVPSTTPGNPLALRPVDPSDGWLADSATLDGTQFTSPEWPEIAPVGEYSGDPTTASWLPSKTMALVYRAHVHEPVGANPTDLGLFVVYDDIETLEYAAFVDFPDETYESIDVYHEDRFVGHLAYSPTTQRVPFMPRRLGNTTVTAVAKYLYDGETHYTSAYTTYNVTVLPDVVPEPVSAGLLLAGAVGTMDRSPTASHWPLRLVDDPAVRLAAADAVGGVEAGEDELHAGRADRLVLAGVDLEGLFPDRRYALDQRGVVGRGEHVTHLDLHAAGENLGDLGQAVLADVLVEHRGHGLGNDGVEYLPLAHLVGAHHVQFQLAER